MFDKLPSSTEDKKVVALLYVMMGFSVIKKPTDWYQKFSVMKN